MIQNKKKFFKISYIFIIIYKKILKVFIITKWHDFEFVGLKFHDKDDH